MKLLVREELRPLVTDHAQPCVSLYMPTLRGRENQQNAIRLKNLYVKARENLIAQGMRAPDATEYLEPVGRMMQDADLWRHCSDGLAVFRSREQFRTYRVPFPFQDTVVVADRFHLKPLLPLFTDGEFFHLLVLGLKGIRLLQCSRQHLLEVDLTGKVPAGLGEMMAGYVPEESVKFHTASVAGGGGKAMGVVHGATGADERLRKKYILEYFQQVDKGLLQIVSERATMLLAGVKYLCSLYRQVSGFRGLLDVEVNGSMDMTSLKDLHEQGRQAYETHRESVRGQALARFREAVGTPAASTELEKIVPAAYNGQVQMLWVPSGLQRWGKFDAVAGTVEVHEIQKYGEEDLVDFAAVHTLMHGGEVFASGEPIAGGSGSLTPAPLAAIFRYA